MENLTVGVLATGLLGYLLWALLCPERF